MIHICKPRFGQRWPRARSVPNPCPDWVRSEPQTRRQCSNLRDALPNAAFIGFTGTPIEAADRDTRAIFGEYIDVYDLSQAVEDGATVRVYYEARLAKVELPDEAHSALDAAFDEVTELAEVETRDRLKTRWARVEAVVGASKRISEVAADIVEHWEKRRGALAGKAMIVCMSRRICVELYDAIVKLRPEWHSDDDEAGKIKVVITGVGRRRSGVRPPLPQQAGPT